MRQFRKSSISSGKFHGEHHRFEHWYRDNSVYFLTSRCRDRYPHTHVNVELGRAIVRAHEINAFMDGVPYKRYQRGSRAIR
jgi:hypothetical protein